MAAIRFDAGANAWDAGRVLRPTKKSMTSVHGFKNNPVGQPIRRA